MKTNRLFRAGLLALLFVLMFSGAARADIFDDAKSKADDFEYNFRALKRIKKSEVERLIKVINEADDDPDELQSVSRDIAGRVKDTINYEVDKLERQKEDALKLLERAMADQQIEESKRKQASDLKNRTNEIWESIQKMTESLRGLNHPVVRILLKAGKEAHDRYQVEHRSDTWVSEFTFSDGTRADGISVDPAEVIEIKPNNSRAVDKGKQQADRYARALNNNPEDRKKLFEKYPKFQEKLRSGEEFRVRIVTYAISVEIDEEGEFRSLSVGW